MANPVMWFEIIGKDSSGLQRFYRETFGWKLTPPVKEMGNYSMLQGHEPGPGGGIGEGDARVSIYVETADPQGLLEKAQRNGAKVLMPVTTSTPATTTATLERMYASSRVRPRWDTRCAIIARTACFVASMRSGAIPVVA